MKGAPQADSAGASTDGAYAEPHPELTFQKLLGPLLAHVSVICRG